VGYGTGRAENSDREMTGGKGMGEASNWVKESRFAMGCKFENC